IYNRSIQKITAFMNDTCPLYNPDGACKCRICKPVYSIDMDKEYTMVQRMMRLADLYRKFEKELPRKNYWEKFLQ
ncbi:sigma-70 family RNA polymerase sigma factor, partial [Bacteroides xylanisolvens]